MSPPHGAARLSNVADELLPIVRRNSWLSGIRKIATWPLGSPASVQAPEALIVAE